MAKRVTSSRSDLILTGPQIRLGTDPVHWDPTVRKVIRGLTFRDLREPAIIIVRATNVLIEDCEFLNIRSGVVGNGVHAIAIRGLKPARSIVIAGNLFADISADGIQAADSGRLVSRLAITDNLFFAPTYPGGENGIDIKGANGPVLIENNVVRGFRPCDGNTKECSGSQGAGIVIHDGEASGRASNVIVRNNDIGECTYGLIVNDADNITVGPNLFSYNGTDFYFGPRVGNLTIMR